MPSTDLAAATSGTSARADYRITATAQESDDQAQTEEGGSRGQDSGGTGPVVRFRVDGREEWSTEGEGRDGAARRWQARGFLTQLQKSENVREASLRSTADQSDAQGGLPLHHCL